MNNKKQTNIVALVIAAVVLIAVNAGVWYAANSGMIGAINNLVLWGAFAVLNVVSIIWATSMLGLQPIVVAISYAVGGGAAFVMVRNSSDISVAEIATAGATYGAFGALVAANALTKVRLAFFQKAQIPFVFIIIGLLVLDAGLNSGVLKAGATVLTNAVALPLIIGGVVGGVWAGISAAAGKKVKEPAAVEAKAEAKAQPKPQPVAAKKDVQPAKAAVEAKPAPKAAPAPALAKAAPAVAKKAEPAPAPKAEPKPAVAAKAAPAQKEEEFFPLEIDKEGKAGSKSDGFKVPDFSADLAAISAFGRSAAKKEEKPTPAKSDSFSLPSFDSSIFASSAKKESAVAEKPAVETEQKAKPEVKSAAGGDWLGGHLELLDKLK